ncbi:fluoride efflux transporter CrcB [Paenibacillus wulumuqiensis]|uniref:fluoride efflux transporter CrcB n=1 Tax=Paenibacillus wulumuqiensis TaxID=1567107 RepID=UPI000619FEE4|nr:fluoride efflux transporter CrcB [Paenibacillus wulumuqiensis]
MLYVLVAVFGVLGAVCRYLVSVLIPNHGFPVATLVINLAGCFLLAVIMKYLSRLPQFSPMLITAMGTGFVGSFTTFSTFSVESIQMIEKQWYGLAALYMIASLLGGLLASRLGFYLSERWLSRREAPHVH